MKQCSCNIKIGSRVYSIISVDDDSFETYLCKLDLVENKDIKSFIDYDEQLVLIRQRLKRDHKRELVLHEIIHACLEDSGASQMIDVEHFVSILSPRLIQIVDQLASVIHEITEDI